MIGVTLGEYFGIGPEIFLKTYASPDKNFPHVKIYGSTKLLAKKADELAIPHFWKDPSSFEICNVPGDEPEKKDLAARAKYVIQTLDAAIDDANQKKISGIVTCPIDKSVIKTILPDFTGHTEYLAEKSGVKKTVMMLCNTDFNIALLTNHVSLRNVSATLDSKTAEDVIRTATESFSKHFHKDHPKMALLGLNPHAGELDEFSEEKRNLEPVLKKLQSENFDISGPFPADSFFPKSRNAGWDIVFSPYHDQGLVAAKYNGLESVINLTLGMPFLRISPGHGVAYDIVDKNIADHRSFQRAIKVIKRGSLS